MFMQWFLVGAIVTLVLYSVAAAIEENNRWRLPKTVVPEAYDLYLYPDLKTGLFRGKVIIKVTVKEEVKEIRLHNNGLQIDVLKIDGKNGRWELDEVHELAFISYAGGKKIKEGDRVLEIDYRGSMRDKIVGLYISLYTNEHDEKITIASSKLEPTNARKAFPCFDEPQLKAEYTVHILKPKDNSYICLSNMPQEGKPTELPEGYLVHFKKSVKMSTYLACFIVCDFLYTETHFENYDSSPKIPLRVYSTPVQVEKTKYALEVARGVIEYYLKYFQVAYPLPKLDLIGIPDFFAGAMEHWGLVTFRESRLLYDEKISSVTTKQNIAKVVAHELAHMWFGNLVTMEWWNDLWLNEGFASYIQYKGINHHHPDWQMMDQFQVTTLHSVLAMDATPASHPIVQSVVTPDQIIELFDFVTYGKGSSVLRMLEDAITEEKFQNGIVEYLKAFAWGNAKTEDLWDKLQEQMVEGNLLNVRRFMDTWTLQKGYPILSVRIADSNKYVLTQERFLTNPDDEDEKSVFEYKWTIPVTYITDQDQRNPTLAWFDYSEEKIIIDKPPGIQWIKFNHKQIGLYRVNYPIEMWKALATNIPKFQSASNRTHLLEEAFSLAEHGDGFLSYDVPLSLTRYLAMEEHYMPWSIGASNLQNLRKYLCASQEYVKYLEYLRRLVRPLYKKLTWHESPKDTHLRRKLRILIISFACSVGLVECKEEANKRFKEWLADPNVELPADLRTIIFKYGMKDSKTEAWDYMLDLFMKEIDANEKINLLVGLASIREPRLLKRIIEFGKDENIIRSQDYFTMLRIVAGNPIGSSIVWDYVRENWPSLVQRFGLRDRHLGGIVPGITAGFTTQHKLKELEVFFATYPEAGAGLEARKIALTTVKNNIRWIERNKKTVENWIRENVKANMAVAALSGLIV